MGTWLFLEGKLAMDDTAFSSVLTYLPGMEEGCLHLSVLELKTLVVSL